MNAKWRGGPAPHSQILGGGFLLAHNNVLRVSGATSRFCRKPHSELNRNADLTSAGNHGVADGETVESKNQRYRTNKPGVSATHAGYTYHSIYSCCSRINSHSPSINL